MKLPIMSLLGVAALLPAVVEANGGGYIRGGIQHAGDVTGFEPSQTEKIRILDEKLTVDLGKKEAAVEVRYLMHNETDGKVKVRFGFPVEESFDNDEMGGGGPIDPSLADKSGKTKLKYCQDYVITAGGKPVTATWQSEETAGDKRIEGIAGWLISELTFAPGEEKPVMIRFRSGYPMEEWSVSDNSSSSARIFKYRLSTAACWAGTLGAGKIVLRPAGLAPDDLKVLKPVNRFKKDGENWVWDFENLEPAMADDLEIEAVPQALSYWQAVDPQKQEGPHAEFIERRGKWTMSHSNYTVTASSTLAAEGEHHYDADQIKSNSGGVWSEGKPGPGIGEWLELKPAVAKPLAAIGILPGYSSVPERFQANARPKKVLVELNGEHRFHADIPDAADYFRIPVTGYDKAVKTVKLTFEEVWPGKKYEDLCISGVRLEVRLDKEPKIQPSR